MNVEARCVTMYPDDWKIVDRLAHVTGLTTSSALRVIVRKFHFSDSDEEETYAHATAASE